MANGTQQRQLTLLELKDVQRDAFECVLSHLSEYDRLFLSKTARGFRDVFSTLHPVKNRTSVNDKVVDDDCTPATSASSLTCTTTTKKKATTTTEEDENKCDEKENGGDAPVVVHARGIVRSAAMARWFLSQGCGDSGYHMMTAAVENGSVEALDELLRPRSATRIACNFSDDCRDWSLSRIAAEHGQIEVLRWLYHEGHRWCEYAWSAVSRAAARGGHVHILKWLHTSGCPALAVRDAEDEHEALSSPAVSSAPVLYYKRQRLFRGAAPGGGGGGDIISEAARWGRLDSLVFLRAIGVPWPSTGCRTAILSGDADVIKWMVTEGCPLGDIFPCSSIVSFIAGVPGSIDILRWLQDDRGMGEPGGGLFRADPGGADKADALRAAAYHGNFAVMRWLRMETGAAWSEETTAAAADGGNIDCLSWLHSNNCPWDEETVVMAAAGGLMDLLQYTHREGLRAPSGKACAAAAASGHMEVLRWLAYHGYPVDEAAAETLEEWLESGGGGGGDEGVAAVEMVEVATGALAVA